MVRLKSIMGYIWAASAIIIVLATYMGNGYFSRQFVAASEIKVNPRFTGGEIVKTIEHDSYRTFIHRPVFDGLLSPRQEGFVQIAWKPAAALPAVMQEKLDYDGDGREDFLISVDTSAQTAAVTSYNSVVGTEAKVYKLRDGWAVRVPLMNKTR